MVTFPDDVIVRALNNVRSAFVRCFERAHNLDPSMGSTKVYLHLEVDAGGFVTAVKTDSAREKLSNCLGAVARQMQFPPPGEPAIVDVPLMF